jgi:hypothetical protein
MARTESITAWFLRPETQAAWVEAIWINESGIVLATGLVDTSAVHYGRTPIGPLTVGFATTSEDSRSLWISFGRLIAEGTILSRGIFR